MEFTSHHEIPFSIFVLLFLLFSPIYPIKGFNDFQQELENSTFASNNYSKKMKFIEAYLKKINKPFVKSIKSPDGDIIDCVLTHLQPAFDHPEIKKALRVIYPLMYNDHSSRLFIYWTSKGYVDGCYNLLCPGFVQIDKTISLGAALTPTSTYNGHQSEITLMLWKYPHLDGWWLSVGKKLLGFWLANVQFPYLNDGATVVEYGGLMYGEYLLHSATQMGSGHFPKEGFRKAAYARNLEVVSEDSKLSPVSNLDLESDQPFCYDVKSEVGKHWGNHIFFGGPGKSASCTIQTFKN